MTRIFVVIIGLCALSQSLFGSSIEKYSLNGVVGGGLEAIAMISLESEQQQFVKTGDLLDHQFRVIAVKSKLVKILEIKSGKKFLIVSNSFERSFSKESRPELASIQPLNQSNSNSDSSAPSNTLSPEELFETGAIGQATFEKYQKIVNADPIEISDYENDS